MNHEVLPNTPKPHIRSCKYETSQKARKSLLISSFFHSGYHTDSFRKCHCISILHFAMPDISPVHMVLFAIGGPFPKDCHLSFGKIEVGAEIVLPQIEIYNCFILQKRWWCSWPWSGLPFTLCR